MKRPNILLINPWIHDFAAYDMWAVPMGLLVLATRLRRMGLAPWMVDFLETDPELCGPLKRYNQGHGHFFREEIQKPECLKNIPRTFSRYGIPRKIAVDLLSGAPRPEVILVTSVMTYWSTGVQETIGLLKDFFPKVPIALGGIYATLLPEHARANSGADLVVPGLGEAEIAKALKATVNFSPFDNFDDGYEFTPSLDLLRKVNFIPVLTSRGCPYRCSYCASHELAGKYQRRNFLDIFKEIEAHIRGFGVKDIALYDDAFLVGASAHAIPLMELCSRKYPDIRWHSPNGLHCREISPEVAGSMKRAGFETIRLGFESSSDSFHRESGSKTSLKQFLMAVRNLTAAGFTRKQIGAYILAGVPGQTKDEIEDALETALEAGATPKLVEYSPIPGSPMWPKAVKKSRYPIETEPLFHNCTLLPVAEDGVDWDFLSKMRRLIRDRINKTS